MIPDKEFEDFFRNRLEDYEKQPPENAWRNIQSDIQERALPKKRWLAIASFCLLLWMIPQLLNEKEILFNKNGWVALKQERGSLHNSQIKPFSEPFPPSFSSARPEVNTKSPSSKTLKQGTKKDTIVPKSKPANTPEEKLYNEGRQYYSKKTDMLSPSQTTSEVHVTESRKQEIAPISTKHYALNAQINELLKATSLISRLTQEAVPQLLSPTQVMNNGDKKHKRKQKDSLRREREQTETTTTDYKDKSVPENFLPSAKEEPAVDTTPTIQEKSREQTLADSKIGESKPALLQDSLQIKADSQEVYKKKRFIIPSDLSIGLYFSPQYTFKRVIPNTADEVLLRKFRNANNLSKERFGYEAGLIIGKQLNRKWHLQLNLHYIQLNEITQLVARSSFIDSVTVAEIVDANTFRINPYYNDVAWEYHSKYNYTGVNASASYVYLNGSVQQLYFTMGGGINLLIKGKTQVYQNGTLVDNVYFPSPNNPFEQLNYRLSFSPGYSFTIDNLKIFMEPTLHYFLGSTYKKREPIGVKPYTLGINIGIIYLGR